MRFWIFSHQFVNSQTIGRYNYWLEFFSSCSFAFPSFVSTGCLLSMLNRIFWVCWIVFSTPKLKTACFISTLRRINMCVCVCFALFLSHSFASRYLFSKSSVYIRWAAFVLPTITLKYHCRLHYRLSYTQHSLLGNIMFIHF